MYRKLKRRLFLNLDTESWPLKGLSPLNRVITVFVLASVFSVILETEQTLITSYHSYFTFANSVFLYVFTIEYIIRFWVMGENPNYAGFKGRIRYIFSPFSIIDLISIVPFWFDFGSEFLLIRILRLLRILKLARIPGLSDALNEIIIAISRRRFEFFISIGLATFTMLVAAILLYLVERDIQPEAFGSIPRALWWGMATLTTVGYGDVYPVTVIGRLFAGIFAFAGIGLVAMPTGVLAAALSDSFQKAEKSRDNKPQEEN